MEYDALFNPLRAVFMHHCLCSTLRSENILAAPAVIHLDAIIQLPIHASQTEDSVHDRLNFA